MQPKINHHFQTNERNDQTRKIDFPGTQNINNQVELIVSNIDLFIDFSILNNHDEHKLLSKIVSENEFYQDLFSQNSEMKRYIKNLLICFEDKNRVDSMIFVK
jgi:hypothetical protein